MVDPVTQEIIEGKLLATVDEMGIVMARTSMSPVIYEVLDFACGVLTPAGDLVAQMNGITLFTGTFGTQVRALLHRFAGQLAPGDVLLTNDPYAGGTHACDFAIVRPVFAGPRLIALAINVAHYLDVGGAVPGSVPPDATSVFQEGLRLPGVRIARNDTLNEDLVHIIRENVRLPAIAMGDLNAQIATVRIAEMRLLEMVAKYGEATVEAAFRHLLDSSERLARAAVAALPDGDYTASDVIDGDGVIAGPIPVTVTVRVRGDRLEADFTGCPPATPGPINCARGALHSAVKTVFKALVAPQTPANDGWFRPLAIACPDDTIFTARKPRPTGWYYEGSVHASELVWKALAPLRPDRFPAGSYASLCATYISGTGSDGRPFIHVEPQHGGWGACADRDGTAGLIALTDGDTYNYSVEVIEAKFPLRVARYALNTEGGVGAGQHRGGYGLVREYEILAEGCVVHASFGRTLNLPWGMEGGEDGSANALERLRADGGRETHGRIGALAVGPGDRVRLITGGGGGWGDPARRRPEAVARDLRDGLLTPAEARRHYPHAAETGGAP
ncbi:MAG: hydantoinase B/oxoprolinase family protein [Rhodobacteraceae bacterium]|nr:hydantoinase B/oxoprolinase family protein [Paracoccaceae bacterium]